MTAKSIVALVVASAVWIYGCFQAVQYFPDSCRVLDWSRATTATLFCIVASGGYLLATGLVALPIASKRGKLSSTKLTSELVVGALKKATVIRVFCSQAESYRGFVHSHCADLANGVTIKVMMRGDGTAGRLGDLQKVADRWHHDIGGRGVSVEVAAVDWSPMMLRGWVFDQEAAVIGWYTRTGGRTTGGGDPGFVIHDREVIRQITETFDKVFLTGQTL